MALGPEASSSFFRGKFMLRWSRALAQIVAVALLSVGLAAGLASSASADTYNPPPGLKLSAPIASPFPKDTIFTHLLRTILSVPKGQQIKIMSWNVNSPRMFNALVTAAKRGVSVQVVMDASNDTVEKPNPGFDWMRSQFRQINKLRTPANRSFAKLCYHSCRGKYGIAHTKMYLFSQAYKAKDVVMWGSFNLTDFAANIQWNDLYTTVGRTALYDWAVARFAEDAKDTPLANPWSQIQVGPILFGLFPYYGRGAVGDPILNVLKQVKCTGTTGGSGDGRGHTEIRIAQTSEAYARGEAIARKLKSLWDQGCNIRMLSAIYGDRDRAIYLQPGPHGPMPFRQIAQDFNGDGLYDRYMHTKIMTITGVLGTETNANYSFDGSANWEQYVLQSDDTFVRIQSPALVRSYNRYINYWWSHVPPKPKVNVYQQLRILSGQVDPYRNIQLD